MLKASRTHRVAPSRVSDLLTQHHPTSNSSAPAIPHHNSKSPTKLCKTPFWSSPGADTASKPTALLSSLPTHLFGLAEDLLHEDEVVAGVSAHQLLQAPAVQAQPSCREDRATVTHSPVQERCRRVQQREGVRAKVFATCVRSQWRKKPHALVLDRCNLTKWCLSQQHHFVPKHLRALAHAAQCTRLGWMPLPRGGWVANMTALPRACCRGRSHVPGIGRCSPSFCLSTENPPVWPLALPPPGPNAPDALSQL